MHLASLRVRNVRSYREARLDLPLGTTLIAGDVGAGKTSLLYAIEMALFGPSQVNAEHLVRHRSADAEVILEVEDAGARYVFRRRLRRHLSRGRATFDPELNSYTAEGRTTEYSATELRQRSIELLGFPDNPNPRARSDVWRWAVYIPQERMRDVLDQNPTARVETVRKALGLEQYRTAWENADLVRKALDDRAGALESEAELLAHWEGDLQAAAAQATAAEAELEKLRLDEPALRERREAAQASLRRIEAELVRRDNLTQRHVGLRAEIAARTRAVTSISEGIATQLRESQELAARADAQSGAAETLERETRDLDAVRQRAATLRQEWDGLEAGRAEEGQRETAWVVARRAVEETASRSDELRGTAERARADATLAEHEGPSHEPPAPTPRDVPTIERAIEETDALIRGAIAAEADRSHVADDLASIVDAGTCPRCHQHVERDAFRTHLAEARARAEAAGARRAELLAQKETAQAERRARERYERALDRYREVLARRTELRGAAARADQELATCATRAEAARATLSEAERRRAELLPRIERRTTLSGERTEAERKLAELESRHREGSTLRVQEAASREAARRRGEDAERRRPELAEAERAHRMAVDELERLETELRQGTDLLQSRHRAATELESAQSMWETALSRRAAVERARLVAADQRAKAAAHLADRDLRRAQAAHQRRLSEWLSGTFRPALLELEKRRLTQAQGEFDRALTRYFASLVEDPTFVARIDGTFSPRVEIDGEETEAAALSGGERTALALAYRLAMGHVVRGLGRLRLGTMVLDEPTDGFSPEQINRMGDLIREIALPQIILVSHEEELAGVADHIVRITKDGGVSRIVGAPVRAPDDPSIEAGVSPSRRRRSRSALGPPTAAGPAPAT